MLSELRRSVNVVLLAFRPMPPLLSAALPLKLAGTVAAENVLPDAGVVTDAVADMDDVEFIEDRNTIRLEVRKILEQLLMQEARIDQSARMKIESQRRTIIEGSEEWSILYRKYYNEEVKKLGF